MQRTKYILFFGLLFGLAAPAFAQNQELPTEQVDVIKDFNARLKDTEKYNLSPELPPLDTTRKRQYYDIRSQILNVEYPPPKIRPIALQRAGNQDLYNGYARLGGGFPRALYGLLAYDTGSEDFDLGIDLRHHSANNDENVENQRFVNSAGSVNGAYYFEQGFALNGKLAYERDQYNFFGYNELDFLDTSEVSFAEDDVKQRVNTFMASAKIFNGERTRADFNYSAGFDFYHLKDNYSVRENGFDLRIQGTKWFNESDPLRLELRTDFTSYRDTVSQDLNNFFFHPSYTYHGDRFKAKVGVNLASSDDEFSFFPDIEVSANVIGSILTAFVGAGGDLEKNNFRNLVDYSPFIVSRIELRNTRYFEYYGGVRGEIKGATYEGKVSYKDADNLALFLSNQDTIPRLNVLYDTLSIFTIQGALTWPVFEGFQLTGTVAQRVYSPENEDEAWHLPAFTVNVGATYQTLENRLQLRGDFYLENGVPFRTADGGSDNLNTLFDISLGAEYRFTDNLGGFVRINNLANNKRHRWRNYPVLGLNGLLGVSAKF